MNLTDAFFKQTFARPRSSAPRITCGSGATGDPTVKLKPGPKPQPRPQPKPQVIDTSPAPCAACAAKDLELVRLKDELRQRAAAAGLEVTALRRQLAAAQAEDILQPTPNIPQLGAALVTASAAMVSLSPHRLTASRAARWGSRWVSGCWSSLASRWSCAEAG